MAHRVCVVGSLNVDLVVVADRLPAPGETVLGGRFAVHDGGKGANQAVASARAGASVSMIGGIGHDDYGARVIEALRSEGVDVSGVRMLSGEPTGVAIIAVGPRGENQIVVAPGANAALELDAADLDRIRSTDVLITNHEVAASVVHEALLTARDAGAIAILNPAPARALSSDVLRIGPIMTPNEHELVVAIGNDETGSALDELAARTAGPIIVTQGPAGALLVDGDRRERFPGHPVAEVVDTTGAGDTFNGALAAWLAAGASIDEAIRAANAAAGLSVTASGARAGMPGRDTIEAALSEG